MKRIFILFILTALFIFSCAEGGDPSSETAGINATGTWKRTSAGMDAFVELSTNSFTLTVYNEGTTTLVGAESGTLVPNDISNIKANQLFTHTVASSSFAGLNVGDVKKLLVQSISSTTITLATDDDGDGTYELVETYTKQ